MEFVNPNILWGLLGISAPILIHFWNKQQSKIVPWAAMQFFEIQKQTVSKGIKINDIWLLLLRVFGIILLTVILAQFLWPIHDYDQNKPIALWMVNTPQIKEEFKFEIEKAHKLSQEIKWQNIDNEEVSLAHLQEFINQNQPFFKENRVEAYLPHEPFLTTDIPLVLPDSIEIKWSSFQNKILKVIHQNLWFYVSDSGDLEYRNSMPSGKTQVVHAGPINLSIESAKQEYKSLAVKSLKAISEVYDFSFDTTSSKIDVFIKINNIGHVSVKNENKNNQYILSENILPLTQAGALPEEMLCGILKTLGLNGFESEKDMNQLEKQIVIVKSSPKTSGFLNNKLLIMFLLVIIIERFWALKMNK